MLERDVDRGAVCLQAVQPRAGLGERTSDFSPVVVEHQNVGREGVSRRGHPPDERTLLVVTLAGQAVPRLQHENFEAVLVAAEGDRGREVQVFDEDRHLVTGRHHDVLTVARIVEHVFTGTERVGDHGRRHRGWQGREEYKRHRKHQRPSSMRSHMQPILPPR